MGILLAPTTGRTAAFSIIGVPLALFLILGFETSGGGSSGDDGQAPGAGLFTQSEPAYTQPSPTYATDTAGSGLAATTGSVPDYSSSAGTLTASVSPTASSASPSAGATGPAAVVITAYDDINRHDYQDAYNLGLGQNSSSYQAFVDGYSTTQSDTITVTKVDGDVVDVSLLAVSTDGSQHTYAGTYTVTGGFIAGADLEQVS